LYCKIRNARTIVDGKNMVIPTAVPPIIVPTSWVADLDGGGDGDTLAEMVEESSAVDCTVVVRAM